MHSSGTIVGHVGAIDQSVVSRSKVIGLSCLITAWYVVLGGHMRLLQLMPNLPWPLRGIGISNAGRSHKRSVEISTRANAYLPHIPKLGQR